MNDQAAEDKYPVEVDDDLKGLFKNYDLGGLYVAAARMVQAPYSPSVATGSFIAYDGQRQVVFRGSIEYTKERGEARLAVSESPQPGKDRGYRICRKMLLIGLQTLKRFIEERHLPLASTSFETDSDKLGEAAVRCGMRKQPEGVYTTTDLSGIEESLRSLRVSELSSL
ncbi:MAG TPA: hypothetical protein VMW41_05640 [Candidatus Bathyarchaeia archaeon]|nr:hypothetical protein [Candidatus Bathyarchaeia archaeon]